MAAPVHPDFDYDEIADQWASTRSPISKAAQLFLTELDTVLEDWTPPLAVLDAGCGEARNAIAIDKHLHNKGIASRVYGVDASRKLIAIGKTNATAQHSAVELSVGDVRKLSRSYAAASMHAVALLNVYHHLLTPNDRAACASGVFRVLKPGGLLVVNDFNPDCALLENVVPKSKADGDYPLVNFPFENSTQERWLHLSNQDEFRKDFEAAGFRVEKVSLHGKKPDNAPLERSEGMMLVARKPL